MKFKYIYKVFIYLFLGCQFTFALDNMNIFPIEHYNQDVNYWISPSASDYKTKLLNSADQLKRFNQFKSTLFGTELSDNSPWSEKYINFILHEPDGKSIYLGEQNILESFNNQKLDERHIGYGQNFIKYKPVWINKIAENINLSQFKVLHYEERNRAITIDNVLIRVLPTNDPFFLSNQIPGQGYPFDVLQMSSLFAGSAVYILGVSKDKSWTLILSNSCIGWVRSNNLAYVDDNFIAIWQKNANSNLIGFLENDVPVIDKLGNYHFSGYVGMSLPAAKKSMINNMIQILIPVKLTNAFATIVYAYIPSQQVVSLPMELSSENFARLIKANQQRPYGWGNIGFYNDCSSELKDIFAMFGIFLPRNSKSQLLAGKVVDLSNQTAKERSDFLLTKGVPFLNIVHIKGHVLLYLGQFKDHQNNVYPISYQAMWGLRPQDGSKRYIIGQAVIFPLLLQYPEAKDIVSELNNSVFDVIYLTQWPDKPLRQELSQLLY